MFGRIAEKAYICRTMGQWPWDRKSGSKEGKWEIARGKNSLYLHGRFISKQCGGQEQPEQQLDQPENDIADFGNPAPSGGDDVPGVYVCVVGVRRIGIPEFCLFGLGDRGGCFSVPVSGEGGRQQHFPTRRVLHRGVLMDVVYGVRDAAYAPEWRDSCCDRCLFRDDVGLYHYGGHDSG